LPGAKYQQCNGAIMRSMHGESAMEIAEATRQMKLLEDRYYELNSDVRAARRQIGSDARDPRSRAQLEARLEENRRQMHAILHEIARVEDSLLD
jgi:hypothetical protein